MDLPLPLLKGTSDVGQHFSKR